MKLLLALALLMLVALFVQRQFFSFIAQTPADYADTGPVFDARKHLGGQMISQGVIYGPTGRVATRFVAEMNGVWQGEGGVLSEAFRYPDGTVQNRQWTISLQDNGRFTATAPDIIGVAVGEQSGATLRMTYRLKLTEAAGGHELDVVDWLYLVEDGTILNKSEMRKFGIKVAELVATIRPVAP